MEKSNKQMSPFERRELVYFMAVAIILNMLIAAVLIYMVSSHLDKMEKKMDGIADTLDVLNIQEIK